MHRTLQRDSLRRALMQLRITGGNRGYNLSWLVPRVNGATSLAAVANTDVNLKQILDFIDRIPPSVN